MVIFHNLYYPEETGAGTGLAPARTEKFDDDTALLDNLIDSKKPVKEEVEEEPEEEILEEPKDELEEEEEKSEDDLLDDTESNRGLDLKKIKEKYPDFAKTHEFRELRNAYYRESKYTELFPTVEDAQEAAENNDMFNKMNDDLINKGDIAGLLSAVKDANPQSFSKIATNFIDTLHKVDANTWNNAMNVVIKRVARDLDSQGKRILTRNADSDDGRALVATARNILLHYFDDDKIDLSEKPTNNDQTSEKEKDLDAREQRIAQEKYLGAYQTCETSVGKRLDEQILNGLDPDEKFSEFTRRALLKEIKSEVFDQISNDKLHVKKMTSLWNRAAQSGYDRNSLSRIVTAYLERARPIIPTVRNKFRSMALKEKNGDRPREESPRIPSSGRSGRSPSNDGKVNIKAVDSKKIDYSKTSDDDILEGRVKLKG